MAQRDKHVRSVRPFSQEDLNTIFQVSSKHPDRLVSRESSGLEFKRSFSWAARATYTRTCAAYANTKGGYVVFGVANRPHTMVGLRDDRFEEIDPEKLSSFFNEHFAPEIHWQTHIHEFRGLSFGLLYVSESTHKPAICTKTVGEGKDLKEGGIYYRYRGRTERVKYPELYAMIDLRREREQRLWLRHLTQIARVGVQDAGVFDINTGSVTGAGGTFVIDESLLDKLSFIRDGRFNQRRGAPAVRVVGDAKVVEPSLLPTTKVIYKSRAIRAPEIVNAFLDNAKVQDPLEYVRQVCFESSAFLPVYHFLRQAKMTREATVSMLEKVQSRHQARRKLIDRVESEDDLSLPVPTSNHPSTKRKLSTLQLLRDRKLGEAVEVGELRYVLHAVRMLDITRADARYLRPLLKDWFAKYYTTKNGALADCLRRAICYLDAALNRNATDD